MILVKVHINVKIPPKISVSNFMGYLKGKSTLKCPSRNFTYSFKPLTFI